METKSVNLHTIEDLSNFFKEKKISSVKTRFFINENRKDPKCFGIYKDDETNNFVVYKNKKDGTRFVRYEGLDEDIAVNIFFSKFTEELNLRKGKQKQAIQTQEKREVLFFKFAPFVLIFILMGGIYFLFDHIGPKKGYYIANSVPYYYESGRWYYYDDDSDDWYRYYWTLNDYDDYYYGAYYDSSFDFSSVTTSSNYKGSSSSSDDSDYDYDYDSWDSSDTDWDSDW